LLFKKIYDKIQIELKKQYINKYKYIYIYIYLYLFIWKIKIKIYMKNKKAFTLVELVIVITVLAILWIIALISIDPYNKYARNSVRLTDVRTIEKTLNNFYTDTTYYPIPEDPKPINYSWSIVWVQWNVWDDIIMKLAEINKIPIDPLTWNEYTYSLLNTKQEFEIWAVLEWASISYDNNILNKSYADNWAIANTKVVWNYNWVVAKVCTWWINKLLAVPSIVSSDPLEADLEKTISTNKMLYNWVQNLPISYRKSWFNVDFWWNKKVVNNLLAFSWSFPDLLTKTSSWDLLRKNLIIELQNSYRNTDIKDTSRIATLLAINTEDSTYVKEYINKIISNEYCWSISHASLNISPTNNSLVACNLSNEVHNKLNQLYLSWSIKVYEWIWSNTKETYFNPITKPSLTKDEWCYRVSTLDWFTWNYFPLEITYLNNLKYLSFINQWLNNIPPEIWRLQNLEWVWFWKNNISSLPSEFFSLQKLRIIDFSENKFTLINDWFWTITSLRTLILNNNLIENFPEEIREVVYLETLVLSENNITTIPDSIWQINTLKSIDLGWNQITVLPDIIWNLINLEVLNVTNNQITALPITITQLTNLEQVYINGNNITVIPDIWSDITELDLSDNNLVNIPIDVLWIPTLKYLNLNNNKITFIPPEISNLTNLEELWISNNKLTRIADELSSLEKLRHLDLSSNISLWNLSNEFYAYSALKIQEDITIWLKAMSISWNGSTLNILVSDNPFSVNFIEADNLLHSCPVCN